MLIIQYTDRIAAYCKMQDKAKELARSMHHEKEKWRKKKDYDMTEHYDAVYNRYINTTIRLGKRIKQLIKELNQITNSPASGENDAK